MQRIEFHEIQILEKKKSVFNVLEKNQNHWCKCLFIDLCFWYGKLRRTDFLPIGPDRDDEVFERGSDSVDSDSEEDCEMAYACGMNSAFMPLSDGEESECERHDCIGNDLADFLPYEESVGVDD